MGTTDNSEAPRTPIDGFGYVEAVRQATGLFTDHAATVRNNAVGQHFAGLANALTAVEAYPDDVRARARVESTLSNVNGAVDAIKANMTVEQMDNGGSLEPQRQLLDAQKALNAYAASLLAPNRGEGREPQQGERPPQGGGTGRG